MLLLEESTYGALLQRALRAILAEGKLVAPRGMPTRELQHATLILTNPLNRHPRVEFRNANIFALHAETLWVLAGRSDLGFIRAYLPRMAQYSNDGIVLSGAYGPRIRAWRGVDQLRSVFNTLLADPSSRRAVISLFDPNVDHQQDSLDIPCTNLLHFTVNEGLLNLHVYSRSMDIMWGSAINFFEWTTIHESLAYWLSLPLGRYIHSIGSLHIYEDFVPRANRIANAALQPLAPTIQFDIPLKSFDSALTTYMTVEANCRSGNFKLGDLPNVSAWLTQLLYLTTAHWMVAVANDFDGARQLLHDRPLSPDVAMAFEQINRAESALKT